MESKTPIGDLLRAHHLKKTPIRVEMLKIFMSHDFALSAQDIITKMTRQHDRVTIYRALNSFEEQGILHRASEDSQGVKYALCGQGCPDELHTDKHAHFICEACHQTYCLQSVAIPEVEVPGTFSVSQFNYTLSGTCEGCTTENKIA